MRGRSLLTNAAACAGSIVYVPPMGMSATSQRSPSLSGFWSVSPAM